MPPLWSNWSFEYIFWVWRWQAWDVNKAASFWVSGQLALHSALFFKSIYSLFFIFIIVVVVVIVDYGTCHRSDTVLKTSASYDVTCRNTTSVFHVSYTHQPYAYRPTRYACPCWPNQPSDSKSACQHRSCQQWLHASGYHNHAHLITLLLI